MLREEVELEKPFEMLRLGTVPLRLADGTLTHKSSFERLSSIGGRRRTNSALRAFVDICH